MGAVLEAVDATRREAVMQLQRVRHLAARFVRLAAVAGPALLLPPSTAPAQAGSLHGSANFSLGFTLAPQFAVPTHRFVVVPFTDFPHCFVDPFFFRHRNVIFFEPFAVRRPIFLADPMEFSGTVIIDPPAVDPPAAAPPPAAVPWHDFHSRFASVPPPNGPLPDAAIFGFKEAPTGDATTANIVTQNGEQASR